MKQTHIENKPQKLEQRLFKNLKKAKPWYLLKGNYKLQAFQNNKIKRPRKLIHLKRFWLHSFNKKKKEKRKNKHVRRVYLSHRNTFWSLIEVDLKNIIDAH